MKPRNLYQIKYDNEYFNSGVWKCSQSPTGAHVEVIIGNIGICKHCNRERTYNLEYSWNRSMVINAY